MLTVVKKDMMYVEQGIKEVNFLIFLIKKFGRFKKWEYLCIAFRKWIAKQEFFDMVGIKKE